MKKRMALNLPSFDGNQFKWEDNVKYLCVCLDQKLNFQSHIKNSINKSNKAIFAKSLKRTVQHHTSQN
jgi:hypothetical protein